MRSPDLSSIDPGQKYGRWTVLSAAPKRASSGALRWFCVCACGKVASLKGSSLRTGSSRGCRCILTKHGGAAKRPVGDGAYRSWESARARCYNAGHVHYRNYGGRGIAMAPEWKDDYARFLADMGPRPPGYSLDRFPDTDGPYAPGNCRWATAGEQNRNTRTNRLLTFNGKTLMLIDWAPRLGFGVSTLSERIRRGWSVERALTEPVRYRALSRKKEWS